MRTDLPLPQNSEVTEDATDGRSRPVDPETFPDRAGPVPVPELDIELSSPQLVAASVGSGNGQRPAAPPGPRLAPVTDEDRTSYGLLLDRAAERGLLSEEEYQRRLGELAEATTVEEMRQIVTELPAFAALAAIPPKTKRRRHHPSDIVAETVARDRPGQRRSSPWVLLAIIVVAIVASAVFFALYAEHLIRAHGNGVVTAASALFSRGVPRL